MKTPVKKPVATLLALAWLTSSVALAESTSTQAPGPDAAERMDRMALLLDLDSYQKTEVEKILKEHHEKMRSEFEAARASGTRPTREEMQAKREQSQQELHTKLSGVLNETQLKKFDALHEGRPGPRFGGKRDRASKTTTDSASN
jgi:hypothetical protein